MKILYVASNPRDKANLNLVQEITELQRRFQTGSDASSSSIDFLPALKVEQLSSEISKRRPDILHIAAHGEADSLSLSDEGGDLVKLSAAMLGGFLAPDHPPRLIYLNACNSKKIAKGLVDSGAVAMAIGSTAPITNRTARASAVAFYDRLLGGFTVQQAFDACKQMLEALAASKASAELYKSAEANPEYEILHAVPRVIADFKNGKPKAAADNHYSLRIGILGCPPSTVQVLFFTDDESFITDENTLEDDLCWLIRDTPVKGILWTPKGPYWRAEGDHRLFAIGVKAAGGSFALATTLCEAIENRFRFSHLKVVPESVAKAIKELRKNDGADLDPVIWDAELERKDGTTQKKRKMRAKANST